jgi:biotin carboxyl carrier protein
MAEKTISAEVGKFSFEFTKNEFENLKILGSHQTNQISLLVNNEVVSGKVNKRGDKYDVEINGEYFEVKILSSLDHQLSKMGMNTLKANKVKEIKAPMPGLVLEVNVEEGDEVITSQKLLILEAMKMENVIKIPNDGKIKTIKVKKGQAVEKGQILIELE